MTKNAPTITPPAPTAPKAPAISPALSRLTVKGFQSLHDARLDLEGLTVVVGASSSGKSALTRALRTLANNARGQGFITQGFKACQIQATTRDGTRVTLNRSRGAQEDSYVILPPGPEAEPSEFTKLGGTAPAAVTQALGFEVDALHLASQFDKPYLLDATPQEVSRVLAGLTDVQTVRAAAREAHRRRLAVRTKASSRKEDLARTQAEREKYAGAQEERARLEALAVRMKAVEDKRAHSAQLAAGIDLIAGAARRLIGARAQLAAIKAPDPERMTALVERTHRAQVLAHTVERAQTYEKAQVSAQEILNQTVPDVSGLLARLQGALALQEALGAVVTRAKTLQARRTDFTAASEKAVEHAEALAAAQEELMASRAVCDKCGQPLPDGHPEEN